MLDAVSLERLGIPTVTFVTALFETAAHAQAAHAGVKDLPIATVPVKVDWPTVEEVAKIAIALVPSVVRHLMAESD